VNGIEDILGQVMASHDQEAPAAADLLRALHAASPPPGRGRARRSLAGWYLPLAAAAAVAAVIAGSAWAGGLWGSHRQASPARLPAAPRQFNPLIPNVSFGWLPAGQSLIQGGARPTEVYLDATGWALSVYARGQCHLTGPAAGLTCSTRDLGGVSTWQLSGHAPAVGGHRAFWAGPNLVWHYARGGWAALNIPLPSFTALRHDPRTQREAIKIAEHLRFGAATPPLVFPAQLTGLTSQWQVSDVHYVAGAGVLRADSYILTTGMSRFFPHVGDLGVWANAPYVEIHPAPHGSTCTPHDPAYNNTSEIINGYRVVVQRMTIGGLPEQDVCAAHADGFWADIEEFGPHPTIGVASLFKHLRLLGTNPANWTRNPIG
jgi:hypothetical protein